MFTGIVDHSGRVRAVERRGSGLRLHIETTFEKLVPGESIAVDGVCLTAVEPTPGAFWADLSPETLRLSIAERYRVGFRLNLERPLALGDRLGGHWVTGHVDGRARCAEREPHGEFLKLRFERLRPELRRYCLPKGSVTVNGVSLTVNAVTDDGFEVMLVPHTLERTNLGEVRPGDEVNVEMDWMMKVLIEDRDARKALLRQAPGAEG